MKTMNVFRIGLFLVVGLLIRVDPATAMLPQLKDLRLVSIISATVTFESTTHICTKSISISYGGTLTVRTLVDWGDGQSTTLSVAHSTPKEKPFTKSFECRDEQTRQMTHTYSEPGSYTVKFEWEMPEKNTCTVPGPGMKESCSSDSCLLPKCLVDTYTPQFRSVTVTGSPDLVVSTLTAPATLKKTLKKASSTVPPIVTVKNLGADPSVATTVRYELFNILTKQWVVIGSRNVPALVSGQEELGPLPLDDVTVPADLAISIFKTAKPGEEGTYFMRACVTPVVGETNTLNNCTETPQQLTTINSACSVPALTPIPDSEVIALDLEVGRRDPTAPLYTRMPPLVDQNLFDSVNQFTLAANFFCSSATDCVQTSSGFRPVAYTNHLWEGRQAIDGALRVADADLQLYNETCADYYDGLATHFFLEHKILANNQGLPMINPPGTTAHEYGLALDVGGLESTGLTPGQIDALADSQLLKRPCISIGDRVHFSTIDLTTGKPTMPGCKVYGFEARSPINIRVEDPFGQRIGFDPVASMSVNEIGLGNYYTGPSTEPQVVVIGTVLPGNYVLTGIGTDFGPYTLSIGSNDEHGIELTRTEFQSQAVPGQAIVPITFVPNQVPIANAGSNRTARLGSVVTLDGTLSSDPDSAPGPLTHFWTKVSGPSVKLLNGTTATASFMPTTAGTYVFELVVNDGESSSAPANVRITVPILGDIDVDGDVDVDDLHRVTAAINTNANGPNDLRDLNGNGRIEGKDVADLAKRCTRPGCGPPGNANAK